MLRNRLFSIILLLGIVSCGKDPQNPAPQTPDNKPETTDPVIVDDGVLSVLAVGNSFSVDGMQYLYDILKADGLEKIALGNLYIGGCTLETHAGHFAANDAAYTYYTNTSGTWANTASTKPLDALAERDWDIITLQQASGVSGKPASYDPYLGNLVAIIKEKCPGAKLYWHMTWAYQGNSTHKSFPDYGSNQMTMYNAILSAYQSKAKACTEKVIPSGTAVQNLRTSLYGDNITRDGYHLSYDAGRLVAALTWAGTVNGTNPMDIDWHPANYPYTETQLSAIKEAAAKALEKPFEISQSSYPKGEESADSSFDEYIRSFGKDPANYSKMEINYTIFAYYNSSNGTMLSTMYTLENPNGQTNLHDFVATPIYTKDQLPDGTLIVVKTGYQYRPEGWVTLTTKNSSSDRPGNVTTAVTEVNTAWWGKWNYRAFNLLKNPRTTLDEKSAADVCDAFGIFLPK